jgi:ribosomal protein S18 acetylase RimI-like enzyme
MGSTYEEYLDVLAHQQLPKSHFVTLKLATWPTDSLFLSRSTLKPILQMNKYICNYKNVEEPIHGEFIRKAELRDLKSLLTVTENAFTKSRFHRDTRIGSVIGERIKAAWIENNILYRQHCETYVYQDVQLKNILGYVSIIRTKSSISIDLIAVSRDSRGNGIGSKLISKCKQLATVSNLNLFVGTQTDNPSNSLYLRLGFAQDSQYFVFHDIDNIIA